MICNESIIDRFPPLWNEMIQIKTSATPLQHPPNHYSCLLSIGTLWRYYCGRQAAALSQCRCSSPLTSTYKTYAGTYGASVFCSAGCGFQSFAGRRGSKSFTFCLFLFGFQPIRYHEQFLLQLPIQFHRDMKHGIRS